MRWKSALMGGGDVIEAPRPQLKSSPVEPRPAQATRDGYLQEYAELAQLVGVKAPDTSIEAFKVFLRKQDWPIYSLPEVIGYMDRKAAAESKDKSGWMWRPLRGKDHLDGANFGTAARRRTDGYGMEVESIPASDHYVGSTTHLAAGGGGVVHQYAAPGGVVHQYALPSAIPVYDNTIPLHALRKVAIVEKEFKVAQVAFFVCDYAPAPHIEYPDPFLMAVINNPKLASGAGRFVIDFWDEPGFGIEEMLK